MSRPNLGYSNYYWIRQDQKRLEKKRTTSDRTTNPDVTPVNHGTFSSDTGHISNPTGDIEANREGSAPNPEKSLQGSTSFEPKEAAAPEIQPPELGVNRESGVGAAMPPAIMPVIPTWTKNITGN